MHVSALHMRVYIWQIGNFTSEELKASLRMIGYYILSINHKGEKRWILRPMREKTGDMYIGWSI